MTETTLTPAARAEVIRAVRYLASVCDGAMTQDFHGFAAPDVPWGHGFAALPDSYWDEAPDSEVRTVAGLCRRYTGQLRSAGIDVAVIRETDEDREAARALAHKARRIVRAERSRASRKATLRGDVAELTSDYDPALVERIRALPGRRWDRDRKVWTVPARNGSAETLTRFLHDEGFDLDDALEAALTKLADEPATPAPEPGPNVTLDGEGRFRVEFEYDPDVVRLVKTIPGRRFDSGTKAWTVPGSPEGAAGVEQLAGAGLTVSREAQAAVESLRERAAVLASTSRAADAEVEVEGLGGTLRPFQRAGVTYALAARRCFIADEMGLGKTVQALATLQGAGAFPAVVVCPASLKLNWRREAQRWLPGRRIEVLSGRKPGRGGLPEADVYVINYDVLSGWVDALRATGLRGVVLDESHYVKSGRAQRTKAVETLVEGVDVRLALSGTPLTNRPAELIAQLRILDRLGELGGWHAFATRYCRAYRNRFGWDLSGSANLEELNTRLRERCYVRRLKRDVLTELPPKQRTMVPLPLRSATEYKAIAREVISWFAGRKADTAEFRRSIAHLSAAEQADARAARAEQAEARAEAAEQLVRIEGLKQAAVEQKMDAVVEWIDSFLNSSDEKLIVFAHHRDVISRLAATFHADAITGDTPMDRRQAAVDRFQTDPEARVIVLNLAAGGVGLTLTAASHVAFVELGWTPAAHDQAEDRAHRIGQTDSVTCWYLLGEGTIDETIAQLIDTKRAVVDAATEGEGRAASKGILGLVVEALLDGGDRD